MKKEVEIFKTGYYKGITWTEDDLNDITESFNQLKDKRKVPLWLGHDKKQPILAKEGFPSAGWVRKLRKAGQSLFATIIDVPKVIEELIERKAYGTLSCGLCFHKFLGGRNYRLVIDHISLLGGEIPAVSSLADYLALYGANYAERMFSQSDIEGEGLALSVTFVRGDGKGQGGNPQGDGGASYCVCAKCGYSQEHTDKGVACNTIKCPKCDTLLQGSNTTKLTGSEFDKSNKKNEEGDMGLKERVEELEKEAIKMKADFADEKKELLEKVKLAEKSDKESKDKIEKFAQETEDKEIEAFVITLIKDEKLLPKYKESTIQSLKLRDNSEKTLTFSVDDGKGKKEEIKVTERGLFMRELEASDNVVKLAELSKAGKGTEGEKINDGADDKSADLDTRAKAYMKENEGTNFADAIEIVCKDDDY